MNDYSDIINKERPISKKHKKMSIHDRAAQFMPFSALKGYEEAIHEKEKEYISKRQLSKEQIYEINDILSHLSIHKEWDFEICYFQKENGEQGNYYVKKGALKKLDTLNKFMILNDESKIYFDDIYEIKCKNYQSSKEE